MIESLDHFVGGVREACNRRKIFFGTEKGTGLVNRKGRGTGKRGRRLNKRATRGIGNDLGSIRYTGAAVERKGKKREEKKALNTLDVEAAGIQLSPPWGKGFP